MDTNALTILGLVIVIGGVVYFMYQKLSQRLDSLQNNKDTSQDQMIVNLNQRVDSLSKNVSESLQKVTDTMLTQLNTNTTQVDRRLQSSHQTWQKSSHELQKIINQVNSKLTQMDEANKRIFDVGKDIAGLQEILRAPKLRGALGELFLGDLLSQIFPKDRYKTQYRYKSGEAVDAVIILRDGQLVSIDAKFPLESFKRMLDAQNENEKKTARKQFSDSVKKRIDEIASKYILPDENTLDFALMYIPAENVYYETIIKGETSTLDLAQYAYGKRVIPVSPNNLYVYLQTIAMGLRGMQIEERAKEILKDLSQLNTEYTKVVESYDVLGKHLSNATGKYQDTGKYLSKFGMKVEQIENKTSAKEQKAIKENSTKTG